MGSAEAYHNIAASAPLICHEAERGGRRAVGPPLPFPPPVFGVVDPEPTAARPVAIEQLEVPHHRLVAALVQILGLP